MAKSVGLTYETRISQGIQRGASGSVGLRGAAFRSAALLMLALSTALQVARLLGRSTTRTSAKAVLLHALRWHSNAKSEYARRKVTGDENAELRFRVTLMWSRPASSVTGRMIKIARWFRMASRAEQRSVSQWRKQTECRALR